MARARRQRTRTIQVAAAPPQVNLEWERQSGLSSALTGPVPLH